MAKPGVPAINVSLKPGVVWGHMTLPGIMALYFTGYAYDQHGEQLLVVTSLTDGEHITNSKHYTGEALDVRLPEKADPEDVGLTLQHFLGPDFDVVIEPDHIHVEFDPKQPQAGE